ncbi:MAG: hypothetical protein Q9159_004397 [Coniocarpon cinnabarinum]
METKLSPGRRSESPAGTSADEVSAAGTSSRSYNLRFLRHAQRNRKYFTAMAPASVWTEGTELAYADCFFSMQEKNSEGRVIGGEVRYLYGNHPEKAGHDSNFSLMDTPDRKVTTLTGTPECPDAPTFETSDGKKLRFLDLIRVDPPQNHHSAPYAELRFLYGEHPDDPTSRNIGWRERIHLWRKEVRRALHSTSSDESRTDSDERRRGSPDGRSRTASLFSRRGDGSNGRGRKDSSKGSPGTGRSTPSLVGSAVSDRGR